MLARPSNRRLRAFALCVALIAVFVLFGVPEQYTSATHAVLVIAQLAVLAVAAWYAGAAAIFAEEPSRQRLALAGVLLITPWVLFSFLAGFGPPDTATPAQNQLRYVILFLNTIAIAGGFVFLRMALREANERFYSLIGVITVLAAAALYIVWAPILFAYFAGAVTRSTVSPQWFHLLADGSEYALFFGGLLFYVTTAAFALSLARAQWLGRFAAGVIIAVSAVAIAFLAVRGLAFPDPKKVFEHWYLIPGYVVGIPAIPWITAVIIGIVVLYRAGNAAAPTS